MPIRVTCPKCHTRFNVSEKFAGKEGPCPKCKAVIKVPDKADEVVIHAPTVGPTDSEGRAVLKPIAATEQSVSQLHMWLYIGGAIAYLTVAFFLRLQIGDKTTFPIWISAVGALLIAPLVVLGAYAILKDRELDDFKGQSLWARVAICGAVYALTWGAMPLSKYGFGDTYGTGTWILAFTGMLLSGGAVGMLAFDFDYLTGVMHYGFYLGLCLLARVIAGIGALPGSIEIPDPAVTTTALSNTLSPLNAIFCEFSLLMN